VVKYPNPANDPNVEIARVTAVVSDAITIIRAQEGTGLAARTRLARPTASLSESLQK
jgi:hypothetical protein